ncbi:MAG: hypothetical protein ACYCZX_11005 [Rhodospirillaceae bacterium]
MLLAGSAWAQIIPLHGELEYSAASGEWPNLTIKAANGSPAYVLTLWLQKDIKGNLSHIDLVLHLPGTRADASNLLDPSGRWHGLQAYDFNASDFTNGPERSIFGKTRTIEIKNRKFNVTFSISKAEIVPVADHPIEGGEHAFTAFAVDIDVKNFK